VPLPPQLDQDAYLKALQDEGIVDHVELGYHVDRVKKAPLATEGPGGRPVITTSGWPVNVQDRNVKGVPDARFLISDAYRAKAWPRGRPRCGRPHSYCCCVFGVMSVRVDATYRRTNAPTVPRDDALLGAKDTYCTLR
jgi:hypothetical protein